MLRCRENDLAVVLGGPYMGYFLTVGKFMGDVPVVDPVGDTGVEKDCWRVTIGDENMVCPDRYLQPIRPGRTPVTTETEKEITA